MRLLLSRGIPAALHGGVSVRLIVSPDVQFGYPCFAGAGKEIYGQRHVCFSTHWLGESPISLVKARDRLAAF